MYKILLYSECIFDNDPERANVTKERYTLCNTLEDVKEVVNTKGHPEQVDIMKAETSRPTDPEEITNEVRRKGKAHAYTWTVIDGEEDDNPKAKSLFLDFIVTRYHNKHF